MALNIRDPDTERLVRELNRIAFETAALTERDTRSAEAILGYGADGLPE